MIFNLKYKLTWNKTTNLRESSQFQTLLAARRVMLVKTFLMKIDLAQAVKK